MLVYLYKVGTNLNRAYRTIEAFGLNKLVLIDCDPLLKGRLFKADGRVAVSEATEFPDPEGLLALETYHHCPLWEIPWPFVTGLLIGGETEGLPRKTKAKFKARIPMLGMTSGLAVEAALAIALYARSYQIAHAVV